MWGWLQKKIKNKITALLALREGTGGLPSQRTDDAENVYVMPSNMIQRWTHWLDLALF